jgi:hypothetical protein
MPSTIFQEIPPLYDTLSILASVGTLNREAREFSKNQDRSNLVLLVEAVRLCGFIQTTLCHLFLAVDQAFARYEGTEREVF